MVDILLACLQEMLKYTEDEASVCELKDALNTMLGVLKYVNDIMHQVAITNFPVSTHAPGNPPVSSCAPGNLPVSTPAPGNLPVSSCALAHLPINTGALANYPASSFY